MKHFWKQLFVFTLLAFTLFSASGQGITTSSLSGVVVDADGKALDAANVMVIHTPSGAQYGTITSVDGKFYFPNLRVGGPYEVLVTFVGYSDVKQEDVYLSLNQTYELELTLTSSNVALEEVVIVTGGKYINSDLTGSMTNVDKEELKKMPTIKRGLSDFTRLTPQSDGNSFGGRNNLYNNFSVDGSIFNNSFGLDYATPGGQTDAQPVSLEAIDQIQVSLAPFDVREGGFTGAGVNAVTKSGDNDFRAVVYEYHRNQSFIGKKVGDVKVDNLDFMTNLFGASVSGPIVKNKLFFFMNYEGERRDELAHGFVADNGTNTGDDNVTSVLESDIQAVQDHLRTQWGYDPGAYQGYNHQTSNDKFLIKLDWNINQNNNFSIRYNYLDSWKDILPHPEAIGGRGATSFRLPFENSSYRIFNKINSVVGELNSRFGNNVSNRLLVSYTGFRDEREPHSAPFPVVDIWNSNGQVAITAGSEMFSTHNVLNQDVWQITDNVTIFLNDHNVTAGFNFEHFHFYNSFNLFYYPWVTSFSVNDFLNDNFVYFSGASQTGDLNQDVVNSQANPYAEPEIDVAQLALYVQDEWSAMDNLKLTMGLRIDMPMYLSEIDEDPNITGFNGWVDENGNAADFNPAQYPSTKVMWSPRLGFNWDASGDNTFQVRGGTGIFTGRIPFVWLGNQASNAMLTPGYTFQINATHEDFKWPQVWKSNLILDKKFKNDWFASVEGIYSKDLNAVVHRNYNMLPPSGQLTGTGDTRAMYAGFNEVNIYSSDPSAVTFLDAGAIMLDNTDKGYQYSVTGKVAKAFGFGLNTNVSYTYMESKDYTSIPAEIAADAFQRNPVIGNPNAPQFAHSRYGLNHRFMGSLNYEIAYGKWKTSFGAFFEVAKGNRYSYTYAGDLNGDAIINNDLLYVPANASDIHFGTINGAGDGVDAPDAAAQWAALNAFIEQDPYLSERRGQYADRHGATQPWFSTIDLRVTQDFTFEKGGKPHNFQLSFDILNFGNMLNSNWGVRQLPTTVNPITVTGVDNGGVPYFNFNTNLTDTYIDDFALWSKWQLQIGLRYAFN